MGGCHFRNTLSIILPKYNRGEFQVFWRETFKIYVILQSRTWSIHFHHRHCGSHEYAHSREKQTQRKLHNSQGFSQNAERKDFSLIMSDNNFRYQNFKAVSGKLGGKVRIVVDVLSSHEQEIYPTTSLDENCIEFEFQTDRNYYVDLRQSFLALKLKHVKGRGYDTYKSKEKK